MLQPGSLKYYPRSLKEAASSLLFTLLCDSPATKPIRKMSKAERSNAHKLPNPNSKSLLKWFVLKCRNTD
ncbi:hypothetical protein L596_024605 [Steinernema carpocapsae]|uniref:Uncharacterized protein n=1 Tax=Steinernema carpocapsae TaxID=34508 RepID=A0A4V5ZYJ7_STECR|nr:hypothetical protein L596_024605 [Steinernema carpocapsae]